MSHVMPPSSKGIVLVSIILTAIAAALFAYQVARVNWVEIRQNWKAKGICGPDPPRTPKDPKETPEGPDDPHPYRWRMFAAMLVLIAGCDLYGNGPSTFFAGECQTVGLPLNYSGMYLGAANIVAFFSVPLAAIVVKTVSPNTIQLVMVSLIALVSIPQGFANQFSGDTEFIALTLPLRMFEGLAIGISETAITSLVFRLFLPHEHPMVMGLFTSCRALFNPLAPPMGSALYVAGGMAAPYLALGSLNILTVVAVSFFTLPLRPSKADTGSIRKLLMIWRLGVTATTIFTFFMTMSGVTALAQPILGVAPLFLDQNQIALPLLAMGVSSLLGSVLIGAPAGGHSPVLALWVAHVPLLCGLALLGVPSIPAILPFDPSLGLYYVALMLIGLGCGIGMPSGVSILNFALEEAGQTPVENVSSLGAIFSAVPLLANGLGPILMLNIDPTVAVRFFFGTIVFSFAISLVHYKFLGVRPAPPPGPPPPPAQ